MRGDLDMAIFDADGQRLSTSTTITDNETLQIQLSPGEYTIRVYGFLSSQNDYVLLTSDQDPVALTREIVEPTLIPDYRRGRAGQAVVNLQFDAPNDAVIYALTLSELKLPHAFLNDLRLTLMWNNEPISVIWDRNGELGRDGGFDDDFMPFTSEDITFNNRLYGGFAGLPANGTFGIKIEDLTEGDIGTLERLRVRMDYTVPISNPDPMME